MRVNEDVIRDIFFKLYFYLPYISDKKPSYKSAFPEILSRYGISNVTAEIKYINSKEEKFLKSYSSDATSVDVDLVMNGYEKNIDMSEDRITNIFTGYLRETYSSYTEVYDAVNTYWKQHSEELMFLITKRNNVENQSIKQEVQRNLSEFNDNALRFINELIQNADDCTYSCEFNTLTMLFDKENNEIIISYPEEGFTYADIISLSSINETNKMMDFDKATTTIGEKGRGFKSIFVYFKEVEIESGGYHFKYNINEASMFQPIYLGISEKNNGTKLSLRLKDEIILSADDEEENRTINADMNKLIKDIENFYGADNPENLFRNNSIFFTRHFTELRIIFKRDKRSDLIIIKNTHRICDSLTENDMWWDNPNSNESHVCEGSMEYTYNRDIKNISLDNYVPMNVKPAYKIKLIGIVKYPRYTQDLVEDRYGKANIESIENISNKMPIIIFGIKDIETHETGLNCDKSKFVGHMYTYLPTSLNLHLPFIFQMPFDLEDNRSCPKSKSKWNRFLLNYVWDKDISIIRDWYEYVEGKSIVDSIYEYLPTKKSTETTYEEIALYIDEEFNFDPMGGSKYAAFAKDQINKFNKDNAKYVRNLFGKIEIFRTLDENKLVSIDILKILDDWLSAFNYADKNIFWDNYKEKHKKYCRFIYSESSILSQKIIEFQRFLGKEGVLLKCDNIFSIGETSVLESVEAELIDYYELKDYVSLDRFAYTFLSRNIWEKKFKTDKEKFSKAQIEQIENWGSKLLFLEVNTFQSKKVWIKYCINDINKLWMIASSKFKSYKYINSREDKLSVLYICILDRNKYKESVIDLLINIIINSMDDVYECISQWNNEVITAEDRLYLAGIYYLKDENYNEIVNAKIKSLFLRIEDINRVVERPKVSGEKNDQLEKYSIEWERIRFLSRNSKDKYALNINFISETIADILNPRENSSVQANDKNIKLYGEINGRLVSDEEKINCLEKFKNNYLDIYENHRYFRYLSEDRNYIKFPASKILILKDIAFLEEASESESILPTEFIQGVRKRYQLVKNNEYSVKGMNRNTGIVKAIQAYQIYSLIDDSNYREIVGKEGIVYNELLQNVNDYVEPNTCLAIRINKETDGYYWMNIVYKEKEHCEIFEHAESIRNGFLASDVLSIISIGNSAKKEDGDKFTGNKGIGFKNVYKIFDVVKVNSNGYSFLLDDSYSVDPEELFQDLINAGITQLYNDKNCIVEKILSTYTNKHEDEGDSNYRKKFPIIQVLNEDIDKSVYYEANRNVIGDRVVDEDSLTAFRFRLKDEKYLQTLFFQLSSSYHVWMIENNKEFAKYDYKKQISNSYNLMTLFLHNLSSIYVTYDGKEKTDTIEPISSYSDNIEDSWVESELFWSNRAYITDLNLIAIKTERFKIRKNTDIDGILSHVEVRFCKIPFLLTDSKKRTIAGNGLLYVTLPTDIKTGGAVHINVPALETKSDRLGIFTYKTNDTSDYGYWNQEIICKVFSSNGRFVKLFNSFTGKYKDIVANYAFLYVPITLYNYIIQNFIVYDYGLVFLKYIPCMTSSGIKMRSLYEIEQSTKTYRLKTYMYQWFDLMDPSFEILYSVHDSDLEFIYMKDENNWDLINEFQKHSRLQPKAPFYNDNEFFGYIALYWRCFYQQLDPDYRKECDRHFENRINLITAKTKIDKHYTKWKVWIKFYKDSMSGTIKSIFIDNMIKAICFDCDDFESYFYFTAESIKRILENEKLDIPDNVVNGYKIYLKEKGFKDFLKYFSLLITELLKSDIFGNNTFALKLIDKCDVKLYTGVAKNELVPIEFSSKDIICRVFEKFKVNRLQQLREHIPILLMNGRFIQADEEKFFIVFPKEMFLKDSLNLCCNYKYDSLVKSWVKEGYVVSKANIATSENIRPLSDLTKDFEYLLKNVSDSQKYLELLWDKKFSGIYINNIFSYWKQKLDNNKVKKEYFALCIDLITKFVQYNNELAIKEPEIKYDIELFDSNKIINDCNKLSFYPKNDGNYRENLLQVVLDEDFYSVNPVLYWNEIEVDLTANQRKLIAEEYKKEVYSPEDVDEGIDSFLKHLYLSDENAATISGYPSGQYLRVFVDGEKAFVLFKDYTESLILLLKEVFNIKLRKSNFKPLVNLDRYNNLLPIGTQLEYEIVKKQVFTELSKMIDEEEIIKKKLLYLSLQYNISYHRAICGYGMKCPILNTNDMIELSSLQVFEYALFGFHVGISLYGSRAGKDLIIKYANSITVCIQKSGTKKKKAKSNMLFQVSNGNYKFDGHTVRLRGADIQKKKPLVVNMIKYIISLLDDISNQLILEIEMTTDKGAKKSERIVLQLTLAHRAIMVYELNNECQNLSMEE